MEMKACFLGTVRNTLQETDKQHIFNICSHKARNSMCRKGLHRNM